jgi:hypothetical protein
MRTATNSDLYSMQSMPQSNGLPYTRYSGWSFMPEVDEVHA